MNIPTAIDTFHTWQGANYDAKEAVELHTTVTATHPLYTNIQQTAELVVVDIKLEPITTETTIFNQTINPSGVPTDGQFGTFRIAVEPADLIPDTDIEWIPYDLTSVRFWNDNSNGREVEMGLCNGAVQTVSVEINDLVHPAPEISFEGHSRRTIPVRFMVTCDGYGGGLQFHSRFYRLTFVWFSPNLGVS